MLEIVLLIEPLLSQSLLQEVRVDHIVPPSREKLLPHTEAFSGFKVTGLPISIYAVDFILEDGDGEK